MDNNKKFQLFGNNKIKHFNKGNNNNIYYFTYKDNSYIFFLKENKILKLNLDKDFEIYNLVYLEEYIENKKDIEISYIEKIHSVSQKNANIRIIKNNQIKDYYLINKKWLDSKLQEYSKIKNNKEIKSSNEYNFETMVPQITNKEINNISYPIDFYFIEKEEYNFEIDELSNIFQTENLPIYQIFFVYDDILKEKQKNIYIGLIYNLSICFYLIENYEFKIEFILSYNNEQIYKEIKDNIIPNGIEAYLNMTSNHQEDNNIKEPISLYDFDLNKLGFYINLNSKDINNIKIHEYSKNHAYIPYTYYYCGIIQCLVNIKPLREVFLNKQFLINKKFTENSPITKKFYQIFQNKWFWTNNNEIDYSLISDINNENSNLFNNCKLLIEFLLLQMHNEQRKENKENYIKLDSLIYNSKIKMKNDFYKNNNTIIQQLFFFEIKNQYKCEKCKSEDYPSYSINCALEFTIENSNKEIKINDFFDNLTKMKNCAICNERTLQSITKFSSCPQYLIIVIKHINKLKDNFQHTEKIELKNHKTNSNNDTSEYNLVSFIKNPPIEEEKKDGIIYCKSPVNNEWYRYEGLKFKKTNINNIIKKEKSIPHLLIYQNKCVEKGDYKSIFSK